MEASISDQLTLEPVTQANWDKFVALFGNRGACANCWCMFYRLKPDEFKEGKVNEINKNRMKQLIRDKKPVGIIALYQGQAIAWCAFAPREDYLKLENSRVHKRIDDKQVWSIPCFFIDKKFRRKGLSVALLKGVIEYAGNNNIGIIEAYPAIPTVDKLPDSFVWTGLYKSFERAGFEIVGHKSKSRPMVRFYCSASAQSHPG